MQRPFRLTARAGALPTECEHARQCPISEAECPGECIYGDVLSSITVGILVFDVERQVILFHNQHARGVLEAVGMPTDFSALAAAFLPPGALPTNGTFRPPPLVYGTRHVGYTAYRMGSVVWILLRDITEKLRLESIAASVESMNNLGYIFSAVRHELGNPINSITAALSMLRADFERYSSDTVKDYLDNVLAELARVAGLLRQLKSFSMYDSAEPQPVNLSEFFDSALGLFAQTMRKEGIDVELLAGGAVWGFLDPTALRQALLNLLANAAAAVEGVSRPRVRVLAASSDGLVVIRVEDNGCGMTPEQMQSLFQPFHTSKPNGTGLGMVITKKVLTKMNGTITVESVPRAGTTVIITLPEVPGGAPPDAAGR